MLYFNWYEKNYLSPIIFYWGFFNTILQLPTLLTLSYSFRLNKKEYFFIITFLSFFFKCFFLNKKIKFKISYSNLYFNIKIKKQYQNFYFFYFFCKLCKLFNTHDVKITSVIQNVNKKNNTSIYVISTKKIFFFISEIFNFIFVSNTIWYNALFLQLYILFQSIFYSTKGISLNFFIYVKFYLLYNNKNYFKKVLNIYGLF